MKTNESKEAQETVGDAGPDKFGFRRNCVPGVRFSAGFRSASVFQRPGHKSIVFARFCIGQEIA
jgi:hypothetical protein